MRLSTIWTMPGMTMRERLDRTGEWYAMKIAAALPQNVRYWAFIQITADAIPDNAVVPAVTLGELLSNARKATR